jgi:hypothetical protein
MSLKEHFLQCSAGVHCASVFKDSIKLVLVLSYHKKLALMNKSASAAKNLLLIANL